ncbi:MAG: hypothetical protein GWN18_14350 [Thermoplasmata archaeon]|nr:hypothetical protein [Thermoplasmata archaeon]NIS13974.1 hypothetical protein [Thermoplasmata archaeon]NIS21811.1 hypothetical protein [Thermoplasmata archaeon]NIT78614.1 hypothetical protein [Thermoplasmata archaeon]NIU50844.1 hypothetical protein [Thermoplasmata archaeon]
MGLLDRFRNWRLKHKTVRLTLGAVPLPTLIPDAEANLREIYAIHKRYRVVRYWEVLIMKADREEFTMQFFPIVPNPEACLAVAYKGRHIVRFLPILGDAKELKEVNAALERGKTFEMTFRTDPGMMSQEGLISIGVIDPAKAVEL